MAQVLTAYDEQVAPWVPAEQSEEFKREVRRKINALAADAKEVHGLGKDTELNGVAVQLRDQTGARKA